MNERHPLGGGGETEPFFQCWRWWHECPELFWALPMSGYIFHLCHFIPTTFWDSSNYDPALQMRKPRFGKVRCSKAARHTQGLDAQGPVPNAGSWSVLWSPRRGRWAVTSPSPGVLRAKGVADWGCLNNAALLCQVFIFITWIFHTTIEQFP